jgi:tetratricopeptide (TPR) repeat protein
MFRRRSPLLVLGLLLLVPGRAWAVKEWYDHYLEARDRLIPAGRCEQALAALQSAVALKPASGLNQQTYGLQFVDYLPYYQMGRCHLKLEDFDSAIRSFTREEREGAILRDASLLRELQRLRQEADNLKQRRLARLARQEVERLVKEANDLFAARQHDDALARLAQALEAARPLDPETQKEIREQRDRIRADAEERQAARERAQRVEDAVAEGERRLEAGRHTEALVSFDEVLALDPRNARALEGQRLARERIQASQTRQALVARLVQGQALVERGEYEAALPLLTEAAAGLPDEPRARDLLRNVQATVERLRQQRLLHERVAGLVKEGEELLALGKYPESLVKFQGALALDPGHTTAGERAALAERMIGEELFRRWLPNQPPVVNVLEPRALELDVEGPTVVFLGSATDDRGLAKVEFKVGDRVVAEVVPPPVVEAGGPTRNVRVPAKELALEPGLNVITVVVRDSAGLSAEETFRITRKLRFFETRAFLPSVFGSALGLIGLGFVAQHARRARARRRRFNPYIAGAPVLDDGMFFGREKLLARILNVLHHNSLLISGERRIGKTTFLYHLARALERDEVTEYRFFPVFVDLQGVSESQFFHALMADAVEALQPSEATRATLRFSPEPGEYDGRDFSHDLQRLIEELRGRTSKKARLALLIDEVDVLNEYSERVNQRLRSIFMKTFAEHLVAVMCGVGIRRVWNSEGSPWYNFFDEIELTPFSREEAEALIRNPLKGVFRYEPAAVEAILEASGLKPYAIQKLCIHAVNHMLERGRSRVTLADVAVAREASVLDEETATPLERAEPAVQALSE